MIRLEKYWLKFLLTSYWTINPATAKNAKQVIDAMEGELTPSGKELNTVNQITKMVLGIGLERTNSS
jgi:hypothetical protein